MPSARPNTPVTAFTIDSTIFVARELPTDVCNYSYRSSSHLSLLTQNDVQGSSVNWNTDIDNN